MNSGRNPVLPADICIPDGEAHVFRGRLYVYGSCDGEREEYCSDSYHVVSTADLKTWTVHEQSFDGKLVPWFGKKLETGNQSPDSQNLYAPDCLEKNGRYYLYFCMSDDSEGVAVSNRPEGPFTDAVQMPCTGIDPAVFQDDDGSVYYYWGQIRAHGVKLNEDLKSFDEQKIVHRIVTEEEHGFHEGSSMRKHNGIYYYVYPCIYRNKKPTSLAYATSNSPLGPFIYRGILIDNAKCDPESWNIHGSINEFNGQWYVFYHRSSEKSKFHRRMCVEKIEILEDGSIPEVKMTSIGIGAPFERGDVIEGWRVCEVENGAYIQGTDLVMCDGSSAVIRYVNLNPQSMAFKIRKSGKGTVTVSISGGPVESVGANSYEVTLHCQGGAIVHSIVFI